MHEVQWSQSCCELVCVVMNASSQDQQIRGTLLAEVEDIQRLMFEIVCDALLHYCCSVTLDEEAKRLLHETTLIGVRW